MRNGLYSCTQDGLKLGSGMSFWAADWILKKERVPASSKVVKVEVKFFIKRRPGAILPESESIIKK